MFGTHFYNSSTRRAVSVFGSLFNDLEVVKTDSAGKVLQKIKVPLSYSPRQKILARSKNLTDPKMAIKLPRLAFEITDMTYDGQARVNKMKKFTKAKSGDDTVWKSVHAPAVYKLGFELNIMTKAQDDALQLLEQILPTFQPDYTVTITDIPDMGIKSDVPIVLNGVTINDDFMGDFLTNRTIVYTLTFEMRVKYYTGMSEAEKILYVDAYYKDTDSSENIEKQTTDGTTTPYTETIDFFNEP
ncbi:MAG: hypothetical protein CMD98_06510 [Gammaproteobacteria bacterium]|nr:hypothetical protein [Gammaproteobacteria bacterium]|tara:strand:- start:8989 stop:9717 length:729 start_codon:yes stop_codon:yes gene_type:complete